MKPNFIIFVFLFFILLIVFQTNFISAKDELTCKDFSGDKKDDCRYILRQGLSESEEQELLRILDEQSYFYSSDNPNSQEYIIDYPDWKDYTVKSLKSETFILASKILLFIAINYIVFTYLTKSYKFSKWQVAD